MLSSLSLNGTWKVRGFDGQHGQPRQYFGVEADEHIFIDAAVPGEIHLDLERHGWIPDCNIGMNAQSARWVEEQIWVYRTRFSAPKEALSQNAWLVFEGLDLHAVIYLNGVEIGRHLNAFMPCRLDVTGKLREGENVLAVSIESGLYYVSDKHGYGYNPAMDHQLHKRCWLRKPQYSFSWDWNPRLVNVGIFRPVRLEWTDSARIDAVTVYPELAEDYSSARIHARVFIENIGSEPLKATVRMHVKEIGQTEEREVELAPGTSRQDVFVEVENPKLWWPKPHGDQPLYNLSVEVLIAGKVADRAERRTGIRSIRIDQSPHPEEGEHFILEVNGRKIFAKGGNWVPPDMIYARTDAAHYRKLVELAVEANFNALRIWGGGLYADHAMLDACDEMGVLVWHDFIFACSKYPGDDPDFLNSVRREVTFNVRDLSAHPSLLVWCGNNELEWGTWDWGYDRGKSHPDYALYHHEIPRIVRNDDPSRPYWPSSPYSLENRYPNDPTTGDQHPWGVSLKEHGTNIWAYRDDVSRFPNEGGMLGASSPATLRQFITDEDHYRLFSPTWEFHDNACNYRLLRGICYAMIEHWLGLAPEEMDFEDYVFFSAVIQAEGLMEYINNFRRRMYSTSSAIFWMYNDSWPASHGWTIVDYYLRRKLAYHPVRRAFAPVQVIPAVEGEKVIIFGVNETPEAWQGKARFGLFELGGGLPVDETVKVTIPSNERITIGEISLSKWHEVGADSSGAFAVLAKDGQVVAQNRIFIAPFKDLKRAKPAVSVTRRGDRAVFSSPTFVWAACIDPDGEAPLSDDVFDLLPGIDYEIDWPTDKPLPKIQRYAIVQEK